MACFRGDLVAHLEEARSSAADDALAGLGRRIEVQLDAEREVEASLGRSCDRCLQPDQAHAGLWAAGDCWHEVDTDLSAPVWLTTWVQERPIRRGDRPPTVRQVFALAAALCERIGAPLPDRQDDMSALIERLRLEIGHPAPRLADTPRRFPKRVH